MQNLEVTNVTRPVSSHGVKREGEAQHSRYRAAPKPRSISCFGDLDMFFLASACETSLAKLGRVGEDKIFATPSKHNLGQM